MNKKIKVDLCHLRKLRLESGEPCVKVLSGFGVECSCRVRTALVIFFDYDQVWLRAVSGGRVTPATTYDVRCFASDIMPSIDNELCRLKPALIVVLSCNMPQ